MKSHRTRLLALAMLSLASLAAAQNKRDEAVREDRLKLKNNDSWYYEDLEQARKIARDTKRPLMIVFR